MTHHDCDPRILIVSPVKDEAEYIQQTIRSLAWQTRRPSLWIIVNDGSSDETGELADQAAREHSWIKVVHRESGTQRRVGPGVIEAFYVGLEHANLEDFDFVVKMDGDILLPPNYFERLMEKFAANPRLGTASGKCYVPVENEFILERSGHAFSHGVAKLYRRECFEEIGGFVREVMWDGIDCHRCRMLDWEAASFDEPDLAIIHLRLMGSSFKNVYHGRMRWGYGQYFMGTHPFYAFAIMCYRLFERPWVVGGLCIMLGYCLSLIRNKPRYGDMEFRRFLRKWQLEQLHGRLFRVRSTTPSPMPGNQRDKFAQLVEASRSTITVDAETDVLRVARELAAEMRSSVSTRSNGHYHAADTTKEFAKP